MIDELEQFERGFARRSRLAMPRTSGAAHIVIEGQVLGTELALEHHRGAAPAGGTGSVTSWSR